MGQQFSAPSVGVQSLIQELPEFQYEKSLGNSRFLKTIQCKHPQGLFIVKVYSKSVNEDLKEYQYMLLAERDQLRGISNILAYDTVIETDRAGFAIRQYIRESLYDRISTRPFLSVIEKKWISYQLVTALCQIHERSIYHGDIKTENVMVTSWNWVYLTDFANFKPITLPDDNPTKFSLFFDASARRSCYVSPERFKSTGEKLFDEVQGLTPQMDVFSLGCTIAEMFLEGSPLFTLSQLLQYRKGEFDPCLVLQKIEDKPVRDMITEMISLDPEKRPSMKDILQKYRDLVFPDSFYGFLHHFVASLSDIHSTTNNTDNHAFLSTPLVVDADARIGQLYQDFSILADVCGIELKSKSISINQGLFPVVVSFPHFSVSCDDLIFDRQRSDLCLIIASVLCSNVRNCLYPTSKKKAIDMLLVLGLQLKDEYKLDRIVPYLISLLTDTYIPVRINALVALTQLLSAVDSITPTDANIFPEYIIPSLKPFTTHRNPMVRTTYAHCIATIAESALLFLEMFEVLKDDPQFDIDRDTVLYHVTFDANLRDLHDMIQEDVVVLLTDEHSSVKKALLGDMPRLCIFFGKQKSNDFLISHIITYLNDPDWTLRAAFCEAIVGIGTFVGHQSLEQFILPMLIMALTDAEEFVVEKVLNSLSSLAELGLILKPKLKELVSIVVPLLYHPNRWIIYGTIGFIASACKILPTIDVQCTIFPLVRPFLKTKCPILTEVSLLENLKDSISRQLYEFTISYAIKEDQDQGKIGLKSEKEQPDLLSRLRDMGMSTEDKDKLVELKFYISKTAKARQRSQISNTEQCIDYDYIALRDQNLIPHTVFLTPPSFEVISEKEEVYSSRPGSPMNTNTTSRSNSPRRNLDDFNLSKRQPTLSVQGRAPSRQLSRSSLVIEAHSETSRASPNSVNRISGLSSAVSVRSRNPSLNDLGSIILEGEEKHIRQLLEKKRHELAQPFIPELGPKVKTISSTYSSQLTQDSWSPKGLMVAQFPEHRGPVNALKLAPDHKFFASCSDDGSVKIWDTDRLLRNVTNRARLTYNGHSGTPVKTIGFVEGRHSLVSASIDGKIHINRVEYISRQQQSTKYTGCKYVNQLILADDYATHISHHETEYSSLLVYATKKGILAATDIRSMRPVWSFSPPPHFGEITSMVVDKQTNWLLCGTHRGVLLLWDLRFGMIANSWQHPSKSAISQLTLYGIEPQGKPQTNLSKTVCMAVDNSIQEISVWNVDSSECYQVWCSLADERTASQDVLDQLYGNGVNPLPVPKSTDLFEEIVNKRNQVNSRKRPTRRVFAIMPQNKSMISGGTDRMLRYHDLSFPEKSHVFSGLGSLVPPVFNSHPFQNVYFNIEHTPKSPYHTPKSSDYGGLASSVPAVHYDAITSVAITTKPVPMVISGSRDGIINVYQ